MSFYDAKMTTAFVRRDRPINHLIRPDLMIAAENEER